MDHEISISKELAVILARSELQPSTKADLIRCELLDRCDIFEPLLRPYRKDSIRGTILEDTIKIPDDAITVKDDLTGVVGFEFDEEAYYGCRDMDSLHDHYEDMGFTIYFDREVIVLHGMDEQEREPDDI
jgi:hypothetical protein